MNLKYIHTLLFLLLLGSSTLWAQNGNNEQTPKDPKAKAILEKLSKKNKTIKSAYLEFEYRLVNPTDKIDEKQQGKAWIKGDMYRLVLESVKRYSDAKTLWTIMDEEVQISNVETEGEEDNAFKPSKILTIFESGFNYKYDKEGTKDGKKVDIINLYPEKADKPYHTIKLYVDKSAQQIHAIEMKGKDGNNYTYTLKKITKNPQLNDAEFTYNIKKAEEQGFDIIDLRDE